MHVFSPLTEPYRTCLGSFVAGLDHNYHDYQILSGTMSICHLDRPKSEALLMDDAGHGLTPWPGRRTICHAACETSPSLGHTDHEGSIFCTVQGLCESLRLDRGAVWMFWCAKMLWDVVVPLVDRSARCRTESNGFLDSSHHVAPKRTKYVQVMYFGSL